MGGSARRSPPTLPIRSPTSSSSASSSAPSPTEWRADRTWCPRGRRGTLLVRRHLYLVITANETYVVTSSSTRSGPTAVALATAAWQPARGRGAGARGAMRLLAPGAFAARGLGVLVLGRVRHERRSPWRSPRPRWSPSSPAWCSRTARTCACSREPRRGADRRAHRPRATGARCRATSSGARRRRAHGSAAVLVLFDLDGFKRYNDTFGHPPATRCCTRLGANLGRRGRGPTAAPTAWAATSSASCSTGASSRRSSRRGRRPRCPSTARASRSAARTARCCSRTRRDDASDALRIADQRMYAQKAAAALATRHQTRDVLLQVLHEREPELGDHVSDVAALAEGVATRARARRRGARRGRARRRAARRRQDGDPRRDPAQARPARRRASGASSASTRSSASGSSQRRAGARAGRHARALQPRALGRARLPGRPRRRGDPARRAHRRRLRRLRRDDDGPPVPRRHGPARQALAELQRCAGTQFDPAVVAAFETAVRSRSVAVRRAA